MYEEFVASYPKESKPVEMIKRNKYKSPYKQIGKSVSPPRKIWKSKSPNRLPYIKRKNLKLPEIHHRRKLKLDDMGPVRKGKNSVNKS